MTAAAVLPQQTVAEVYGPRRTGKTGLLLAATAGWIQHGLYIVYVAPTPDEAAEAARVFVELYADDSMRVCRAAGDKHVRHESGGRVQFIPEAVAARFSGAEVALLDNLDPLVVAEFPRAHVFRSAVPA